MRIAIACAAFLLPCAAFAAAPAPDANELIRRAAAVYRDLASYEFRVTVQTVVDGSVAERHLTETGAKGRFRVKDEATAGELHVSDGRTQWVFSPKSNEYSQTPASAETATPVSEFAVLDRDVENATVARQEQFLANGRPVPVFVVRVARRQWPAGVPAGTEYAMYRIDQRTSAIHKAIYYGKNGTVIRLYNIVKWNQPVADSLFAFAPPAGARTASSIGAEAISATSIVGSQAPDFTLKDANGRATHLRDLNGNVVIVDFWATWCPPCRALIPHLAKLHEQYGDRGLTVLGLDVGEDAATVTRFANAQSIAFTLLLGAEPDVSARYFVEAYPTTFVIDRTGRIAFREVGGVAPDKLRAAVEEALGPGATK